jgi:protein-tyrosine phosphatase
MSEKILIAIVCLFAMCGCGKDKNTPDIHALCLRDDIGNYIIKWELDPHVDGTVKVYASNSPEKFEGLNPVSLTDIKDGITTYISNGNTERKYFKLIFNNKYTQVVGARYLKLDSVQNMREIGGYHTKDGKKSIRWGKVFRSGRLVALSDNDRVKLSNVKIKTVLDLCAEDEKGTPQENFPNSKIVNVPISIRNSKTTKCRLRNQEMRRGDGAMFIQDMYLGFLEEKEQFGKALKLFANKDNYPIVVNCSLGKDRVGYFTMLLLSALDIPEDVIRKDYRYSNEYLDFSPIASDVQKLNDDTQEAITVILHANDALLDLVFKKIRKEYGSIDKYLSHELGFTDKDRENLKSILLE